MALGHATFSLGVSMKRFGVDMNRLGAPESLTQVLCCQLHNGFWSQACTLRPRQERMLRIWCNLICYFHLFKQLLSEMRAVAYFGHMGNRSAFAVHSLKPALKLSYEQTGDLSGYFGSDLHHRLMSFLRTVPEPVIPQRWGVWVWGPLAWVVVCLS